MSKFYIDTTGSKSIQDILDNAEDGVKELIDVELEAFTFDVERDAKLNLGTALKPGGANEGKLRQSINGSYADYTSRVTVASNYAAYVEFGTGEFAASYVPSLPVDIQEYAMQFFVNGKGRLPAHPFLFPAYFKNIELLKQRLQAYNEGRK